MVKSPGFALIALALSASAAAQDASQSALENADDAFGTSVGQEKIGIYHAGSVRGFDPTGAGNTRVEGLYADFPSGISDTVMEGIDIRVGLAGVSTPLAAPSGVVDISLKKPGEEWSGSVRATTDDLGYSIFEAGVGGPVSQGLGVRVGALAWNLGDDYRGVDPQIIGLGAIVALGEASNGVTVFSNFTKNERKVEPWFYPTIAGIPTKLPRDRFLGQEWSQYGYEGTTAGVIGRWNPSSRMTLRASAMASELVTTSDTYDLIQDWELDGTGHRAIFRVPARTTRSFSGEYLADWHVAEGGDWDHTLTFGVRGRTSRAEFGGGVLVASGSWDGANAAIDPPDQMGFGALSLDMVDQATGIYRWVSENEKLGFARLTIAPTRYEHTVRHGDSGGTSGQVTRALLYSGMVGFRLARTLILYGGSSRGIESSGVAPFSATNRGEVLPAALSTQYDVGLQASVGPVTAMAGAFEISRPYAILTDSGLYKLAAEVRHRGFEGSIRGKITPALSALAGFYVLDAKLTGLAIGEDSRPNAVPSHRIQLSGDLAVSDRLNVDASFNFTGPQWLRNDGPLRLPASRTVDLGMRYSSPPFGEGAALRLRITNLFDTYVWRSASDGAVSPGAPRRFSLSLSQAF